MNHLTDIKNILNLAKIKGYQVHNKRCEGNPLYTSEETKTKDAIQEIALLVSWIEITMRLSISVSIRVSGKYSYHISKWNTEKVCWESDWNITSYKYKYEAYYTAIEEVFKFI